MKSKIENEDVDGFWDLFPQLKQYVELFLMDYYKLFPDKKPAEEVETSAPVKQEEPKIEFKAPKKKFLLGIDEEDDVIAEIKKQKMTNQGNLNVDARKFIKKEEKVEELQSELDDKLKKFNQAMKKKDEVKDINEDLIFNNVMNLAKANDNVGPTKMKSPPLQLKKNSSEAPELRVPEMSAEEKKELFK